MEKCCTSNSNSASWGYQTGGSRQWLKVIGKAGLFVRGEGRVGAHWSDPNYMGINEHSGVKVKHGSKWEIGENATTIRLCCMNLVSLIKLWVFLDIDSSIALPSWIQWSNSYNTLKNMTKWAHRGRKMKELMVNGCKTVYRKEEMDFAKRSFLEGGKNYWGSCSKLCLEMVSNQL